MIQIHERTLNFHERELRGSDVSQGFWGDFHWGMIQIHERALNFHERELRGSDVSQGFWGDFHSGRIQIHERALNFHERELSRFRFMVQNSYINFFIKSILS